MHRRGRIHRTEQPNRARVGLSAYQYAYADSYADGDAHGHTDRHTNEHTDTYADEHADRNADAEPLTNMDSHANCRPANGYALARTWREVD
jgi:hypothetical protein